MKGFFWSWKKVINGWCSLEPGIENFRYEIQINFIVSDLTRRQGLKATKNNVKEKKKICQSAKIIIKLWHLIILKLPLFERCWFASIKEENRLTKRFW